MARARRPRSRPSPACSNAGPARNFSNGWPHQIVKLGISQVPEGRMIFANLTVLENLQMGAYLRKDKTEIQKEMDYVFSIFPRLCERLNQVGGTLSGGEQQM